jgi:hypothetical protein
MAVKSCGCCADGWMCEIHPGEPWTHHVSMAEECAVAMPCTNPTCPLSWANSTDPRTGLIRPREDPNASWRLPSPVLRLPSEAVT